MKDQPHAVRIRRLSGCAVAGALLLSGGPALAQTFPDDAQWIPLTRGGAILGDAPSDAGATPDLVGDQASPAAYVYIDPQYMFFRLRTAKPALIEPPSDFEPYAWVCLLDIDADASGYELSAGVAGAGTPDEVDLWRNLSQASPEDPADEAELVLARYPATAYARSVPAPSALGGAGDFFVDWAVQRTDVFFGAPMAGPVRFACGSSAQPSSLSGDLAGSDGAALLPAIVSDPLICDEQACWESPCFGAGQGCWTGLGACAAPGVTVCDANGQAVCGAVAGQPEPEACDGIDNDCDGVVDNGLDLGADCTSGTGACAATGTIVCTPEGTAACSAEPGLPAPELCDGIDNDCGGSPDDGFKLGAPCTLGVGACEATGVLVCVVTGVAACDAVPQAPSPEVCDGLDNDCDGVIDNGLDVGAPCGVGTGACFAVGVIECDADGIPVCSAVPGAAAAEQCDGLDNDCDGIADDGLNLGVTCSAGLGACRTEGKIVCSMTHTAVCDAVAGEPSEEVCDGIDNDCDGEPDEGCDDVPPDDGCHSDSECGGPHSGVVCDLETHLCVMGCRALGNGCPSGLECTSLTMEIGQCISTAECQSDEDCACPAGGRICDWVTGQCVDGCRSDAGCGAPLSGKVCDAVTQTCIQGCFEDAGCGAPSSGQVCDVSSQRCVDGCHVDADCGGNGSGRVCDTAAGLCAAGCHADAGCLTGQICVIPTGDTGVCTVKIQPTDTVQPGGGPSCAVPKGSTSRDLTAYLLLAMAALVAARRARR